MAWFSSQKFFSSRRERVSSGPSISTTVSRTTSRRLPPSYERSMMPHPGRKGEGSSTVTRFSYQSESRLSGVLAPAVLRSTVASPAPRSFTPGLR